MSSSDVSQPLSARAFLAAAGLSTTSRIASRPSASGAMKPMMSTFFAQGGGHFTQHPRPIIYPYAKLLRFWHGVSSTKNCDLGPQAGGEAWSRRPSHSNGRAQIALSKSVRPVALIFAEEKDPTFCVVLRAGKEVPNEPRNGEPPPEK